MELQNLFSKRREISKIVESLNFPKSTIEYYEKSEDLYNFLDYLITEIECSYKEYTKVFPVLKDVKNVLRLKPQGSDILDKNERVRFRDGYIEYYGLEQSRTLILVDSEHVRFINFYVSKTTNDIYTNEKIYEVKNNNFRIFTVDDTDFAIIENNDNTLIINLDRLETELCISEKYKTTVFEKYWEYNNSYTETRALPLLNTDTNEIFLMSVKKDKRMMNGFDFEFLNTKIEFNEDIKVINCSTYENAFYMKYEKTNGDVKNFKFERN